MPTKKKAPAKKKPARKKKPAAHGSGTASASKEEAGGPGGMFWFALLVVVLAAFGALALRGAPSVVEDAPEVVEEVEGEKTEEVSRVERIGELFSVEGYPDADAMSDDLKSLISEAYEFGELIEVDSERAGRLDVYVLAALPTADRNTQFCGSEAQPTCFVVRSQGPSRTSVLSAFDTRQGAANQLFGTLTIAGSTDGGLLLEESSHAHVLRSMTMHFVSQSGDRIEVGSLQSTEDDQTDEVRDLVKLFITEGADTPVVTFTYMNPVDGVSRLLVAGADNGFDVIIGDGEEVVLDWAAMVGQPEAVIFSVAGNTYSYNRGGLGTFQVE